MTDTVKQETPWERREREELERFMRWVKRIGYGFLALVGVSIVLSSFFTISERERGVVLRWKQLSSVAEPGLHWKIPIISSVVKLPVDNQTVTVEKMSAGSADQQEAIIKASLNWRLNPDYAGQFYARFKSVENAESSYVLPRFNARTKVVFGQFTAATTFSNRGLLNSAALSDVQASLGDWFIVDGVQVENVEFDAQYTNAINQRMEAEVQVAREKQTLERERIQAEIKNTQADAEKYRVMAEGEAIASATKAKGEAEAIAIKLKGDALKENPGLIQLELAGRWNGTTPSTYIGDGKGALPILPLGNHQALDTLKPVFSSNR